LSRNDKIALGQVLQWQGKNLRDCSKGELVECILHLTMKVALFKDTIDRMTTPFYKRPYWTNRFYFRGWSWWGVFNTITATLFNRVVVRLVENSNGVIKVTGHRWDKGTDHPRSTK
jgi:hypothetical protein